MDIFEFYNTADQYKDTEDSTDQSGSERVSFANWIHKQDDL